MALQTVGWLQNAGAVHTAAQLRTYLAALQAGNFSTATTLRARGGVHPSHGQELVVTQTGSPSMGVLVEPGTASIPGTESATQGNYMVLNDAQATVSVTAAHGSLARIDLVVINVRDAFYSGVNNDAQLQVVAGTPASSPVAPSAPNNSIVLAQIAVGAGVTSITNANITDLRYYMAGQGGVIKARTSATRPPTAEVTAGQPVWVMDGSRLEVWDGFGYQMIFPGYNKLNEVVVGAPTNTVTFSSLSSVYKSLMIHIACRGTQVTQFVQVLMRFNNDSGANYDSEQLSATGATPSSGENLNNTGCIIGDMPGASCIAGSCMTADIRIPVFAGTTFWKGPVHDMGQMAQTSGGQANQLRRYATVNRWRNTAAINRVDFVSAVGNFETGSTFEIYGVP